MAQHCKWNDWMNENIRHALMFNQYGRHPIFWEYTYQEYPLYPPKAQGCKYIDVVGKWNSDDSIKESVVVEVKSCWSDFNSGHGLNFYGNWNFVAVDATDKKFAEEITNLFIQNESEYSPIGIIKVMMDGSVETIIPAKPMWHWSEYGLMYIENHWEDCEDDADKDGDISDVFKNEILPLLRLDDDHKSKDVERLKISRSENRYNYLHSTQFLRENVLKIA